MLMGDNNEEARPITRQLNAAVIDAAVKPLKYWNPIREFQRAGHNAAMVRMKCRKHGVIIL